jgi:hypothetical protein
VRHKEPRNCVGFSRKGLAEATHDATTREEATMRATLGSNGLTEVKTEVRARGDMDMGGARDGVRNAPTVMTMEMAMAVGTAVIPTAVDTASTATPQPVERNQNGKRRSRSKAQATEVDPGDWMSHMEQTAQQQARELAELH